MKNKKKFRATIEYTLAWEDDPENKGIGTLKDEKEYWIHSLEIKKLLSEDGLSKVEKFKLEEI